MKRTYPSPGFLFRFGEVEGALVWNRIRLGLPLGAITIDSRLGDGVVQGRVETTAVLLNVVVVGIPTAVLLALVATYRRSEFGKWQARKRSEDPDLSGGTPAGED